MKFSVIIPVGNSTKNLPAIITQLDRIIQSSLEIIFILDGFFLNDEEKSLNYFHKFMLDTFFIRDIKIISILNKSGPGVARNIGIKAAVGDWLMFIDDDDLLFSISDIKISLDISFDLYLFTFKDEEGFMDNNLLVDILSVEKEIKTEKFLKLILDTGFFPNHIQQFLYNRNFIIKNNIQFPCTYLCEDITFNSQAIILSKNIGFLSSYLYFYRKGISTTKKIASIQRAFDPVICINLLNKNSLNHSYLKDVKLRLLHLFISRFIYEVMNSNLIENDSEIENLRSKIINVILNNQFICNLISNNNLVIYCDGPVSKFIELIVTIAKSDISIKIINDFNIHEADFYFKSENCDTCLIIANIQSHLSSKIMNRALKRWKNYDFIINKNLIIASDFINEFIFISDDLINYGNNKFIEPANLHSSVL